MFESFSGCNIINRPIIVNFWSICGTFHPLTSANRFYMTLNFKWNCSPLIFIRCRNYHNSTNFRQMALFQTETFDKIWGKRSIFGFFLQFLPPNTLNCGPNDWNFPENTVFIIVYKISWSLCEKCPFLELFWSIFSRIRTEYEKILRISSYSVRMWENTNQNNSEYGQILRSGLYNFSTFSTTQKKLFFRTFSSFFCQIYPLRMMP